jgi:hypothetical protein
MNDRLEAKGGVREMSQMQNVRRMLAAGLAVAALAAAYPVASLAGDAGGGPLPTAPVHK